MSGPPRLSSVFETEGRRLLKALLLSDVVRSVTKIVFERLHLKSTSVT